MIKIYGRTEPPCPFCVAAVDLCRADNIDFEYHDLSMNSAAMFLAKQIQDTVPLIYEDDVLIGGLSELKDYADHLYVMAPGLDFVGDI